MLFRSNILTTEGFVSKRALGEMTENDLMDDSIIGEIPLPRGDVRVLLALAGDLNPSKRARMCCVTRLHWNLFPCWFSSMIYELRFRPL